MLMKNKQLSQNEVQAEKGNQSVLALPRYARLARQQRAPTGPCFVSPGALAQVVAVEVPGHNRDGPWLFPERTNSPCHHDSGCTMLFGFGINVWKHKC
jgi:hypothetical protein